MVLTGSLDDGASGLYTVKERGGKAVVQDPQDALYSSMPMAAMKAVAVAHCVPIIEMGKLLVHLTNETVEVEEMNAVSQQIDIEVGVARADKALEMGITKLGEFSQSRGSKEAGGAS